jgi:hypothetical protein
MPAIDQNSRGPRGKPLFDTYGLWQSDWDIFEPTVPSKPNGLGLRRVIPAIDDGAVSKHGTAKQLEGSIAGLGIQLGQESMMGRGRDCSADGEVRRLPDPPTELKPCALEKLQELRHRVSPVLGV